MWMLKGIAEPGSLEILREIPLLRRGLRFISGKGTHSMEAVMRKINFEVFYLLSYFYVILDNFNCFLVRGYGGGFF